MRKLNFRLLFSCVVLALTTSCAEKGCTDPLATNYDADATENDNSCVFSITGCTDTMALNYNSLATVDDNSCEYGVASVSDQILGNWNVDSSTVGVLLPQDMLTMLISKEMYHQSKTRPLITQVTTNQVIHSCG